MSQTLHEQKVHVTKEQLHAAPTTESASAKSPYFLLPAGGDLLWEMNINMHLRHDVEHVSEFWSKFKIVYKSYSGLHVVELYIQNV